MDNKTLSIVGIIVNTLNCVLLFIIIVLLSTILNKMPPNMKDLINAKSLGKQQIAEEIYKMPLVRVYGSVDVTGSVDVNGSVEVENTPLPVEIEQ